MVWFDDGDKQKSPPMFLVRHDVNKIYQDSSKTVWEVLQKSSYTFIFPHD